MPSLVVVGVYFGLRSSIWSVCKQWVGVCEAELSGTWNDLRIFLREWGKVICEWEEEKLGSQRHTPDNKCAWVYLRSCDAWVSVFSPLLSQQFAASRCSHRCCCCCSFLSLTESLSTQGLLWLPTYDPPTSPATHEYTNNPIQIQSSENLFLLYVQMLPLV